MKNFNSSATRILEHYKMYHIPIHVYPRVYHLMFKAQALLFPECVGADLEKNLEAPRLWGEDRAAG